MHLCASALVAASRATRLHSLAEGVTHCDESVTAGARCAQDARAALIPAVHRSAFGSDMVRMRICARLGSCKLLLRGLARRSRERSRAKSAKHPRRRIHRRALAHSRLEHAAP